MAYSLMINSVTVVRITIFMQVMYCGKQLLKWESAMSFLNRHSVFGEICFIKFQNIEGELWGFFAINKTVYFLPYHLPRSKKETMETRGTADA